MNFTFQVFFLYLNLLLVFQAYKKIYTLSPLFTLLSAHRKILLTPFLACLVCSVNIISVQRSCYLFLFFFTLFLVLTIFPWQLIISDFIYFYIFHTTQLFLLIVSNPIFIFCLYFSFCILTFDVGAFYRRTFYRSGPGQCESFQIMFSCRDK